MAIQGSGPISFSDLRTEAGTSNSISLNDPAVRDIIGATGTINIGSAYSKTRDFTFNIPALSTRSFITTLATEAGWQGTGNLVAVIQQGTVTSTLVTGQNAWGTIALYNSGFIMGKGGNGGAGNSGVLDSNGFSFTNYSQGTPGLAGADGLVVSTPSQNRVQRYVSVFNFGTIAGGGGGGGGGSGIAAGYVGDADVVGGGGGGGGRGNVGGSAGAGGIVSVINGSGFSTNGSSGNSGTQNSAGGGGPAGAMPRFDNWVGGAGGNGGALGAAGSAGIDNNAAWNAFGAGGAGGSGVLGSANINGTASLFGNNGTVIGTIA